MNQNENTGWAMAAEARASLRHFLSAALIFNEGDQHSRTLAAFDEWFALVDSGNGANGVPGTYKEQQR